MKERILKNWTITRVLYMVIGLAIIIQSIYTHQWFGVIAGSWLGAMGLFAFGCAGGNCYGSQCDVAPKSPAKDID